MRFGINLRGDLAKLNDAEIAPRYESLIAEKVAQQKASPPLVQSKWLYRFAGWMRRRGPFHARIFYKAQALVLGVLLEHWFDGRTYLRECELKDVTDEIRRRVRHRAKGATARVTP